MLLVQIEGWENVLDEDTPAVYCANHESYMVCPPAHALAASMTTPKK
jgi:1-acyl-sn-glycerol-3-phosphate acyltransferase